MPRVLRIINRLNLGGPTYNAVYLTKYLAPEYETMLLAGMKDESEASSAFIAEQEGVPFQYISTMHRHVNLWNDWQAYKHIKKIILQFKPHIVHTHAAKAGILGRWAALSCKVPVIIHTFHGHVFHSYFNSLTSRFIIEVEKYFARKCSSIIALSDNQKVELLSVLKIPDKKICTIPLGFNMERFNIKQEEKRIKFRKRFMLGENDIAIGVVGRMVPVKNLEFFVDVIAKLLQETKRNFNVFMVGDGESKNNILYKIKQYGLSYSEMMEGDCKNVNFIFTSWDKKIDEVMAGLDLVSLCSLNEGTPVSIIEAQTAGKPVISTNVGGVEDIIADGKTGLLSEVNNRKMFVQQLKTLIENDELRKNMGIQAKENIGQRFNYLRLVKDTKLLYDNLLSQKTFDGGYE